MPPSRGFWPAGHFINRISRPPIAIRSNVRTLSSASLARHGTRSRVRVASVAAPAATGYVIVSGKANLSLWPFGSGKGSTPPEAVPATTATSPTPVLTSSPSEAAVSAASTTQDTAVVAPAQSQAILPPLQEAAGVVKPTESSQAALEKMHDAATNPALLENITQIGQMKELGLDYGWGPTSMVEWVVEHMHVYTGTPWWGTIIASAIAMRVLMIYPFFKMSNQQARLAKVHPLIQKHMAEYQQAQMEGDKMAAQIASKQVSAVRKRNGIQMGWMFAPMIVQGVFGYGAFKLTRAMAQLPVPGFETGGFAWMMDLTKADPTYITPISMWFMMHFLARYGAADVGTSPDPAVSKMAKPLGLYIFPSLMFLVTFWQPAALQLSFLAATMFGTIQNLVFRNPKFRRVFGMEPLPQHGAARPALNLSSTSNPPSGKLTQSSEESGAEKKVVRTQQNPFKDNPFANLNMARPLKPSGSAFESGVKYQAPTAAETLVAGLPQQASEADFAAASEDKKQGIIGTVKNELGQFVEGAKEKGRSWTQTQKKPGDKGRDYRYVDQAAKYEARKRAKEEKMRETKGR